MNTRFETLYQLGQPAANDKIWPDYLQYGFTSDDVPKLVSLITEDLSERAVQNEAAIWAPVYAWRILGQLKDASAIEPLIATFNHLHEDAWALTELPWVMGMLGAPAIEPLNHHFKNYELIEFSRVIAMEGLAKIAIQDFSLRAQIVDQFRGYLNQPDLEAYSMNSQLMLSIVDLRAVELIEEVRKLYVSQAVDDSACGDLEEIEIKLGVRKTRSTPKPDYGIFKNSGEQPVQRDEPKIGRNDPCICGSGKKFKKCCLQ